MYGTPGISVLLPTRGRPTNVRRLMDSVTGTAVQDVEVVLYVDEDDPTQQQVWDMADEDDMPMIVLRGPRIILSSCWNLCAEAATNDIMMHCGDDIIFRTFGWDQLVVAAFEQVADKIALVHGRDGIHDGTLATHGFLHRRWVETTGYLVPPLFASDYNDLWLSDVANALGRRIFLPDVYTEHMHPAVGKAELDQTHRERLARHAADDCDQIWRDTAHLRDADVAKLRAVMDRA
jgi:hypothetical protein